MPVPCERRCATRSRAARRRSVASGPKAGERALRRRAGCETSRRGSAPRRSESSRQLGANAASPLGTGFGRDEASSSSASASSAPATSPAEIAIQYDRRETLAAMGVLPQPRYARGAPDPFPAMRFVPRSDADRLDARLAIRGRAPLPRPGASARLAMTPPASHTARRCRARA